MNTREASGARTLWSHVGRIGVENPNEAMAVSEWGEGTGKEALAMEEPGKLSLILGSQGLQTLVTVLFKSVVILCCANSMAMSRHTTLEVHSNTAFPLL